MRTGSQRKHGERGVLSVMFALSAVVLLAFAGLAIDVGYMQWEKRRMQVAADAAAMGGLRELELNVKDKIVSAGRNDAKLNGFTNGVDNATVSINNPPSTGTYSTDNLAVEAIVSKNIPTFFMRVFGQNGISVSARAVAKTSGTTSQGAIGSCIYALNPTAKSAFKLDGSASNMYVYTSCSITDESSDNAAYTQGSNAVLHIGNAQVGVVGNWVFNGGAEIYQGTTGTTAYNGPVHVTSPGDPFGKLNQPDTSGLSIQATNLSIGNGQTATLQPGIYCGGISISNGANVTFNSGLYVLAGGNTLSATGGNLTGNGVMFYIRKGTANGCSSSGNGQKVGISGGTVSLVAPASGSYEGFLFWEDRNCGTACNGANITGNGTSTFDGALYFKNSALAFAGTNSTSGYMVLVADTIELQGSSTFGNNYSSLTPGSTFPFAPLATGGGLVQ